MRRSSLIVCALLVTATFGCEQVKKQVANVKEQVDAARQRFFGKKPTLLHGPTARPAVAPPPAPALTPQPVQQLAGATTPRPHHDVPYVSEDTGTVFPGMSERDVYSLWGSPVAVRHLGEFTYLYFNNGCEYSCGHLDVVTLQNNQVVDALVRWPGHGYAGASPASPSADSVIATPPGDSAIATPPAAPNPAPDTAPPAPAPAPQAP
jgi:hypothetical protein